MASTTQATAEALGHALRRARLDAGLSQEELGAYAEGVDRHLVADLEQGRATTQLRRLISLLDAVGLELVARPRTARLAAEPDRPDR